jgi:hypothetical protein
MVRLAARTRTRRCSKMTRMDYNNRGQPYTSITCAELWNTGLASAPCPEQTEQAEAEEDAGGNVGKNERTINLVAPAWASSRVELAWTALSLVLP